MQALFDAIEQGNLEEVKRLIDENIDKPDLINCELNESRRVTPLFEAIRFGRFGIVEYLYGLGAKLPEKHNPLELAALYGHNDILEFFISKEENFDIEAKVDTDKEETLLQIAAQHVKPHTVKLLLDKGAKVDIQEDKVKCTALHILAFIVPLRSYGDAFKPARGKCIEYLLDAGADVSIKMARNQTAYDIAVEYEYGAYFQQLYFNRLITSLAENTGKVTKQAQDIINELVDKGISISELPGLFKAFKEKHPNISFQYQRQAQGLIYHALWEKQEKSQKKLLKIAGWMALSIVMLPIALILLGVWGWKRHTAPVKAAEVNSSSYKTFKDSKGKKLPATSDELDIVSNEHLRKVLLFTDKPSIVQPVAKDPKVKLPPIPEPVAKLSLNAALLPDNYHGVIPGLKEVLTKGNMLVIGEKKQIKKFENKVKVFQAKQARVK